MGHHGRRRRRLHGVGRVVDVPLPGIGADAHRVLLQSGRRRAARSDRPAEKDVSEIPLLTVENLAVEFRTRGGVARALEAVGLSVRQGETVGIVGESGSGKSVTAHALLGLLPPSARVTTGRAVFGGLDLVATSPSQRLAYRGRKLSMIFQN